MDKEEAITRKKPKNHGQPWTPTEDKQLRERARGNTPTRVNGQRLDRTEDAIRSHASEIARSLRPPNQSRMGPAAGNGNKS